MCSWSVPQPCFSLIIYLAVCLGAAEGEGSEKHANGSQLSLQTSEVYSTTKSISTILVAPLRSAGRDPKLAAKEQMFACVPALCIPVAFAYSFL